MSISVLLVCEDEHTRHPKRVPRVFYQNNPALVRCRFSVRTAFYRRSRSGEVVRLRVAGKRIRRHVDEDERVRLRSRVVAQEDFVGARECGTVRRESGDE